MDNKKTEENYPLERVVNSINKILMRTEIPNIRVISVEEFKNFCILWNSNSEVFSSNLNIIYNSKNKFSLPFLNQDIFGNFLILWTYTITDARRQRREKPFLDLIKIINKLFKEKFLNLNFVEKISKFLLLSSLTTSRKEKNSIESIENFYFLAYSFELVKIILQKDELDKEEEDFLYKYFEFFSRKLIKDNPSNIFSLIQEKNTLKAFFEFASEIIIRIPENQNEELTKKIKEAINSILMNNFTFQTAMVPLINQMKKVCINFHTASQAQLCKRLNVPDFQNLMIMNLFEEEEGKDPYKMEKGFFFWDKSFLFSGHFRFKKNLLVAFSFNLQIKEESTEEYWVLQFIKEDNREIWLGFAIQKKEGHFFLQIQTLDKNLIETGVEIIPNKTYIFFVFQKRKERKINLWYFDQSNRQRTYKCFETSKQVCEEGTRLLIGCKLKEETKKLDKKKEPLQKEELVSSFTGEIGTVIAMCSMDKSENLTENFIENMIRLKGRYDHILSFLCNNEYKNLNKYNFISESDFIEVQENMKRLEALELINTVVMVISPYSFQFAKPDITVRKSRGKPDITVQQSRENLEERKIKKNYNYIDHKFANKNIEYKTPSGFSKNEIELSGGFSPLFHTFWNYLSSSQFLVCEGLKLLQFQLEFYYQILLIQKDRKEDEEKEKLYKKMYVIFNKEI